MTKQAKPSIERIADQIEMFNRFLIKQLLKFDKLFERLDVTGLNAKWKEYFGIFFVIQQISLPVQVYVLSSIKHTLNCYTSR